MNLSTVEDIAKVNCLIFHESCSMIERNEIEHTLYYIECCILFTLCLGSSSSKTSQQEHSTTDLSLTQSSSITTNESTIDAMED
jgi:hypothetical protein